MLAHLVSRECVRMSRQLTMMGESLPVRGASVWKEQNRQSNRGGGKLTKERNPVPDKSCQLTKQAAKGEQGNQEEQSRENKGMRGNESSFFKQGC